MLNAILEASGVSVRYCRKFQRCPRKFHYHSFPISATWHSATITQLRMHAGAGDTAAWAPVPDGVEFPLNATPMQLLSKGHVAPVPLLLGSNSDEGTGFMANDSSMTYALPLNTSGQEWIDWLGTAFVSRGIFGRSDAPQVHSGPLQADM